MTARTLSLCVNVRINNEKPPKILNDLRGLSIE